MDHDPTKEASDMLAAALEQMDDILAGTGIDNFPVNEQPDNNNASSSEIRTRMHRMKAVRLMEDLRNSLEGLSNNDGVMGDLSKETQSFYKKWMPKALHSKELLSRTALETHKLDLMAEISALKLKLVSSEKERQDVEEKLSEAQRRIEGLQTRLNEKTLEVTDLHNKKKNGSLKLSEPDGGRSFDRDRSLDRSLDKERTLDRLRRKHSEVEKLKKAVDSLMVTNNEKDRNIDELLRQMKRYRRMEELLLAAQGRKGLEALGIPFDEDHSDGGSTQNSSSSVDNTMMDNQSSHYHDRLEILDYMDNHPHNGMPNPSATSTPVFKSKPPLPYQQQSNSQITPPSSINPRSPSPKITNGIHRSNSAEDLTQSNKKSPGAHRRGQGYAQTEAEDEAQKDKMAQQYRRMQEGVLAQDQKKKKGIRKLIGKLRRSSSQDLEGEHVEAFKRSGLRATAGPRLGWSRDVNYHDVDVPFSRWDGDRVSAWLHSMGLSMYVGQCKRWVKNGDQLLKATPHELEKEMGMRNTFHRKKLQLALQAVNSNSDSLDVLDHTWVARWLDDIGLPQYKDHFSEARIDGRMLHYLTVEDLVALKVTSTLHHLSIKRGIQVLRLNNFNPACLKRRPAPDEQGHQINMPNEVMLWTHHRVMEWLRTIDLSEYAPNLRGSGVHGSLMVLEPRFTAELFASILAIPNNKTLLRRHLSTHFIALIGNEMQHKKRDTESQPGYIPLTPNQKVKIKKRLFHKRTRSESDFDAFVCPLNLESSSDKTNKQKDEKAAKQIGAYSTEIKTLTTMLARDRFLDNVPTSNV